MAKSKFHLPPRVHREQSPRGVPGGGKKKKEGNLDLKYSKSMEEQGLKKHERDLLATLRMCKPNTRIEIMVESEGLWIVMVRPQEKIVYDFRGITSK